ncbi:MAG: flagellar hook protein FlgE [Acidobacteriota bacterium]
MSFTFSTALSGLRASSNSLSVAGNNIANANTTAFKSSSITFADIYLGSIGARFNGAGVPVQIGNGVSVASVNRDFSQGNLSSSNSPTNLAIEGNGYFVVKDSAGVQSYTRAGDFILDKDGFLVTPSGQQVQGYAAVNGVVPPDAALTTLQVPIGETIAPRLTSEATLRMNLNAADANGTQFNATVQVFDSLGRSHNLNLVFTKTADLSYSVTATLDGNAAQTTPNPADLQFDANGNLTMPAAPATLSIMPDQAQLNGATLPSIDLNLYEADGTANITNFATASSVSSTTQDGFPAGAISGLITDKTGTLIAVFNNGQTRPIGQIALATFNSQDGLQALSNNLFSETSSSGPPSIGRPSSGGRGNVVGNALEQSNVDIATEFTNLIIAQRSFQANSRVITTVNQTLQDLLQII